MEARDHDVDDPSEVLEALRALHGRPGEGASFIERIFGTPTFFRLWLAQALSSLGDWLGFLAILILANRLGSGAPGASVGLVMAARIVPGFFLSAGAGVLIDRMDRKQVMVASMLVRALVVAWSRRAGTTRSSLRWCGRSTSAWHAGSSAGAC
jgi:MFS family permease